MKKGKSVIVIVLALAITALCLFTAFVGWGKSGTGAVRHIKTGLDLAGGVSITYETDEAMPSAADMGDTIQKLQHRVDQYSTESNVYQEGANRINIEIPGVTNADEILEDLGSPGSLYFIAQKDSEGNDSYKIGSSGAYELADTIENLEKKGAIVCTGADVDDAQGGIINENNTGNKYVVDLKFKASGTQKFAEATKTAYENGQTIGIYYDGEFISVPTVQAVISDGSAQITGMESMEAANQLAAYIRIGGLTLTLHEIRSNVVGAQLGQDAIRTSLIGGAIGLAIVCLIMIIIYLVPGVIAAFVLVLYTALMLLLLNAFDLTLTLPGIAGIILSIGMAVDANVIIYGRIREDITAGASVNSAIRSGFKKATSAIVDGNVTTLIAAAVLGVLGSGTIRGFALTLALGVALSMFTSLVISRLLVYAVYGVGVRKASAWARAKKEPHINFIKNAKKSFIVAGVVIGIGLVFMIVNAAQGNRALNFSLEFLGGTSTTVSFEKDYSLSELDNEVKPVIMEVTGDANVSMQKVVGSSEVIIKTRTLNVDERQQLTDKLHDKFNVDSKKVTTENISATVGAEMRRDAILAVIIAVILMLLYIVIRFRDVRFASAAVLALIHDVLVTLAAYAVLRISVGNSFIAVMLTILGYSINSTIVIFDRIREKLPTMGKNQSLRSLVNASVNQTLSRSIYTNLTTLASILVLYIVGVASIKEFTLPMMVGIVAGTFSSVCITGALWYFLRTRVGKGAKELQVREEKAELKESSDADAAPASANTASAGSAGASRSGGNPNVIRKKKKK